MDHETLSCVRGYHIYYAVQNLCVGEMLCCETDRHNLHNGLAVSVNC